MEITLGKVVDSFEPIADRSCPTVDAVPTKTLEEQYQVSRVHQLEEEDGTKLLEIPAGDYVPVTKPVALPIITSMTSGKHGGKPRIEMSQEPLFDDIDPSEEVPPGHETPSFVDAFISDEIDGLVPSEGAIDKKGEAAKSLADM